MSTTHSVMFTNIATLLHFTTLSILKKIMKGVKHDLISSFLCTCLSKEMNDVYYAIFVTLLGLL